VIDPNISPLYEAYLRVHCTRVVKVEERDDTGGFLKTRLRTTRALLAQVPQSYWPNQYENRDGMAAHYRFTAAEICRAQPRLDYVFLGVGSGGTLAGVSRRLKEHDASVRIVAVDPEGSMIFGTTPRPRHIPGIGSSISPALVREALVDDVAIVPEQDAVAGCHLLLRRHGLFVGGSSGAVYAAIQAYFRRNPPATSRPRVLFLCMDRGTAYLQTVFNPAWVASRLGGPVPTS
jgi:cysteine synthase A